MDFVCNRLETKVVDVRFADLEGLGQGQEVSCDSYWFLRIIEASSSFLPFGLSRVGLDFWHPG